MSKRQSDDDRKDSFVVYKEWQTLISSLEDADRLRFFDLLMGWDFITIPNVGSRHLQSIVDFVFGKIGENREKYLEKCKTNSEAAKQRWDEYKRLKAIAMQTDANAYERTKTHVNAMPNENGNVNEHDNSNEHDNDIPSKEGVGVGGLSLSKNFDQKIAAWAEIWGTIGTRRKTENAYIEAVKMIMGDGGSEIDAHNALGRGAAADRSFCIAVGRKRLDPHTWLANRGWERDYAQELNSHKEVQNSKTQVQNGKSTRADEARAYTDSARRHAEWVESQVED